MGRPKKIKTDSISITPDKFLDVKSEDVIRNDMTQEEIKIKTLGLFDHIKEVTRHQDKKYFNKISDADKRSWSNYMINRFLSMNENFIELINETQMYTVGGSIDQECMYKMLIDLIPKSNVFLQYIKSKNEGKYKDELIKVVAMHFCESKKHAIEYIEILHKTGKVQELRDLLAMYGYDEKKIEKIVT